MSYQNVNTFRTTDIHEFLTCIHMVDFCRPTHIYIVPVASCDAEVPVASCDAEVLVVAYYTVSYIISGKSK